jgi:hypothetical protein
MRYGRLLKKKNINYKDRSDCCDVYLNSSQSGTPHMTVCCGGYERYNGSLIDSGSENASSSFRRLINPH